MEKLKVCLLSDKNSLRHCDFLKEENRRKALHFFREISTGTLFMEIDHESNSTVFDEKY